MLVVNIVGTILAVIMGTIIFSVKWLERQEKKEKELELSKTELK